MNYQGIARTNYFKVRSKDAFAKLETVVSATGGRLTTQDHKGEPPKSWSTPVAILWPDDEPSLSDIELEGHDDQGPEGQTFFALVQPLLKDKSVLVYQSVGNEGMRYVSGFAFALCGGATNANKFVELGLDGIVGLAVHKFKVDPENITDVEY